MTDWQIGDIIKTKGVDATYYIIENFIVSEYAGVKYTEIVAMPMMKGHSELYVGVKTAEVHCEKVS